MSDPQIREAIDEITASKALDPAEKKLITQLLHDHDAALADNQKLRMLLASQKKESKHQEEYIESLKNALSVRVHDFGFTADSGIDGLLVISTLKKNLKRETDARIEAVEAYKGLEDRLQSCKQTLTELLRSSQVAAKKLKQANEKIDRYDAHLNIWASDLTTEADFDKVGAKVREFRDLRETIEDIALELDLSINRPISSLRSDVLKTIESMKLALKVMDNELEQKKAENQDMAVIQEQLTNTVAEQEQIIESTKPLIDQAQTEEILRLNTIIDELRHQLAKMQTSNDELTSKVKEADLLLMRKTIDVAVGRSFITPEEAIDKSTKNSIQTLSNSSYGAEVTGSVINTLVSGSTYATHAMKLSDLQTQQVAEQYALRPQGETRELIDQINVLLEENSNLKEDKRELERQLSDLQQLIEHKDMNIQLLNAKEANSKSQLNELISENIQLTEEIQRARRMQIDVPNPLADDILRGEVMDLKAQISLLDKRLQESEVKNSTLINAIAGYEDVMQKSLGTIEKLAKGATLDLNAELNSTGRYTQSLTATDVAVSKPPCINANPIGNDGLIVNYELRPGDQMDLQATETGHVLSGIIGGNQICIATAPLHGSLLSDRVLQGKRVEVSTAEDKNQSIRTTVEKVINTYRQFGIEIPNSLTKLEEDVDL